MKLFRSMKAITKKELGWGVTTVIAFIGVVFMFLQYKSPSHQAKNLQIRDFVGSFSIVQSIIPYYPKTTECMQSKYPVFEERNVDNFNEIYNRCVYSARVENSSPENIFCSQAAILRFSLTEEERKNIEPEVEAGCFLLSEFQNNFHMRELWTYFKCPEKVDTIKNLTKELFDQYKPCTLVVQNDYEYLQDVENYEYSLDATRKRTVGMSDVKLFIVPGSRVAMDELQREENDRRYQQLKEIFGSLESKLGSMIRN